MDSRPLGQSGLHVSAIGLGTVTFGREIDRDASFGVLDRALEQGLTLFDTAEAYANGASETILGQWLADRKARDRVVLATKVSGQLTKQRILTSADDSLRRLQTDRVDLFQLHNWDAQTSLDETLPALETLVLQGKARCIGVSNWQTWQLCKALLQTAQQGGMRIESVQPPYNLVQREIEADLLPLCNDQQIGIVSYSPLGAGFLTGKYRRGEQVPAGTRFDVIPGHQPIYFTDAGFRVLENLRTISQECGRSLMDLSLSWVLGRPGVTSVLIGARNTTQVDQAVQAQSVGLDENLCKHLESL